MRIKRACLFAGLMLLSSVAGAIGAKVYLSPDGNDGNDGSTWTLAKRTLAGALAAAGSGDVVLATNGTYTSTHFAIDWIKSGETVRSVNGPDVTAITRYDSSMPCVRVEGTLDGFTVKDGITSAAYKGGGVLLIGGVLMNCIVTNCTAGGDGGGVYLDSSALVSNCVISGNSSSSGGGGVIIKSGLITHSTISGNTAGTRGGGVYATSDSGLIEDCIIRNNVASGDGGGCYGASAGTILGCVVAGNQSGGNGGGVHFDSSYVESCTIIGNTASGNGSGVYATFGGSRLRNCIVYYNESVDAYLSASITLKNCCFETSVNSPGMGAYDSFTNTPEFIIAGSGYGTNHVFGNYMLRTNSPCIDTGYNYSWMIGTNDLAGTNRIINSIVNMGAYEGIGSGKDAQTITFAPIADQLLSERIGLSATASSGLPVSFAVTEGASVISGGTNLSFTDVGPVSITASQAGDETYDQAPDVTRSFLVYDNQAYTLNAVALTNSVVLRWPDPYACAISNRTVLVRFSTSDYPEDTAAGTELYRGTNQVVTHTNLSSGQVYYYTAFVSQDGSIFTNSP